MRTIAKVLGVLAVIGGAVFLGGRVYYAELLNGPELVPAPAGTSLKTEFPPPAGWSEAQVSNTRAYADSLASSAVIVLWNSHVVAEWGATDQRSSVHSVRKSLVSALYGIAVDRGMIDVNQTLAGLGIDDVDPPLSEVEKSARLVDLLTARSGIYHPSVKDDGGPLPERGSHRPDEVFVYNNWSFNALGGIFERLTGLSLGEAFDQWIARPIGMQDFRPEDVLYFEGSESRFPAYRFWMSARDLARFGQLYLDGGRWHGEQIVPEDWIGRTFQRYSDVGSGVGYGYLWWIMPDSSYMATGTGGQKIRVYPDRRLVLVNRVYTGSGLERAVWWAWGGRVDNSDIAALLRHLEADLGDLMGASASRGPAHPN
jgi:CubicO group peptidase (beta-lactamase class C family)